MYDAWTELMDAGMTEAPPPPDPIAFGGWDAVVAPPAEDEPEDLPTISLCRYRARGIDCGNPDCDGIID